MKTRILAATAIAAAVAVPLALAGTASTVNGVDRANGARACSALKAGVGATTFSRTYATFGSCVSAWASRAHTARVAATASCKSRGLTGSKLNACVKSGTTVRIAPQVAAYKNAAKACAAELRSLGTTAFEAKYGSNRNLRNAFGKCVSGRVSKRPPTTTTTTTTPTPAQHYAVTLSALNASGVSGTGTLLLNANKLQVKLTLTGLEANKQHEIAIRGLSSGNASCPTASADTDKDGTITQSEGQQFFGSVLLSLDPATTLSSTGSEQTVSSSLLPLQSRTVVILGKTVNGTYDATLPVACGTIATSS